MESYTLTSRGQLLPQVEPDQAIAKLTALRIPEATAKKLVLQGPERTLKRLATLAEAQQLQVRFERCGLRTEIGLKLSPECLRAGLRDRTVPVQMAINTPLIGRLEQTVLRPTIIALGKRTEVEFNDGSRKCVLEKIGYSWNPRLLLVAVLLFSLHNELYLVRAAAAYLDWRWTATVAGILFLIACVLLLPRLLQPAAAYIVRYRSQLPRMIMELPSLHPTQKRYHVLKGEDAIVSEVTRGKDEAIYSDDKGTAIYTWSSAPVRYPDGADKIQHIHDSTIGGQLLGPLTEYIDATRLILSLFERKRPLSQLHLDDVLGTAISDTNGKALAVVYRMSYPVIKIDVARVSPEQEADLICFAITIFT